MGWTEIAGFASGALCVWLVVRGNLWNFPVGIANNAFFIALFVPAGLYADSALQVVYIVLAGLGWYWWLRGGDQRTKLRVGEAARLQLLACIASVVVLTALMQWALHSWTNSTVAGWDALTTGLSLTAQFMLSRRWVSNWWFWIAADLVYVPLYAVKGLWLTSGLYAIFLAMCIAGLVQWRAARASASGHGLVLGKFWPLHAGHQHLIETALAQCDRVTVMLLAHPDEDVPLEVRAAWIREIYPQAHLVAAYDDTPVDFDDPAIWDLHLAVIEPLLAEPVDVVFTSDEYGAELAHRLHAGWVQVDPGRVEVAVSGTAVRADPARFWTDLHPAVRAHYVRRVVITGAESTGTTTLAEALAERLGCPWVPEHGRAWTTERPGGHSAPWRTPEFVDIARHQIADEEAAARRTPNRWLVCDTDAQATTVWHERYVPTADAEEVSSILAAAAGQVRPFARILTGDEIAFVQDGLRDGEHIRHGMQQRFREVLDADDVPWVEVHGSVAERLDQALAFLDALAAAHQVDQAVA